MGDDDDKTEEPTQKKIDDAYKDGNVPKSQDTAAILPIIVALASLYFFFPMIIATTKKIYVDCVTYYPVDGLNKTNMMSLSIPIIFETVKMIFVIAVPTAIAGVLGNIAQFGFNFTTKPLEPDFKKIDPIKGMKNLFSMKKMIDGVKITTKVGVAFGVGFYIFLGFIEELPTVVSFNMFQQLDWLVDKIIILASIMVIIFAVFAALDLVITRKDYFDKLKMSKQDLKDEYKNTEGNPEIKGKIKQKQMEMAKQRMSSAVPNADVVVTNPTHYAIALKYDKEKSGIPMVVAKGMDNLAQKIKEIARENDVPIVENKPLAQALYKQVDVDQHIPDELFGAVAEVLAYVYKANNKKL